MSLTTIFYLADIVTGLAALVFVAGVFLVFVGGAAFVESNGKSRKASYAVLAGFALLVAAALLPSKSGIYTIFAAGVAEKVLADPRTEEIGSKLLKLANQKLDEALEKAK